MRTFVILCVLFGVSFAAVLSDIKNKFEEEKLIDKKEVLVKGEFKNEIEQKLKDEFNGFAPKPEEMKNEIDTLKEYGKKQEAMLKEKESNLKPDYEEKIHGVKDVKDDLKELAKKEQNKVETLVKPVEEIKPNDELKKFVEKQKMEAVEKLDLKDIVKPMEEKVEENIDPNHEKDELVNEVQKPPEDKTEKEVDELKELWRKHEAIIKDQIKNGEKKIEKEIAVPKFVPMKVKSGPIQKV